MPYRRTKYFICRSRDSNDSCVLTWYLYVRGEGRELYLHALERTSFDTATLVAPFRSHPPWEFFWRYECGLVPEQCLISITAQTVKETGSTSEQVV